jgi:hypothetical protein
MRHCAPSSSVRCAFQPLHVVLDDAMEWYQYEDLERVCVAMIGHLFPRDNIADSVEVCSTG